MHQRNGRQALKENHARRESRPQRKLNTEEGGITRNLRAFKKRKTGLTVSKCKSSKTWPKGPQRWTGEYVVISGWLRIQSFPVATHYRFYPECFRSNRLGFPCRPKALLLGESFRRDHVWCSSPGERVSKVGSETWGIGWAGGLSQGCAGNRLRGGCVHLATAPK